MPSRVDTTRPGIVRVTSWHSRLMGRSRGGCLPFPIAVDLADIRRTELPVANALASIGPATRRSVGRPRLCAIARHAGRRSANRRERDGVLGHRSLFWQRPLTERTRSGDLVSAQHDGHRWSAARQRPLRFCFSLSKANSFSTAEIGLAPTNIKTLSSGISKLIPNIDGNSGYFRTVHNLPRRS